MSTTSHTAGPWKAVAGLYNWNAGLYNWNVTTSAKPRTFNICTINADRDAKTNAHLISAAPDLLRAAVAALTIVAREQPDGSIMADLLAAIAKAEGRK